LILGDYPKAAIRYPLLISHNDKFVQTGGESYRTKKPVSGTHVHDPIDAAVFRIDGPAAKEVRHRCLTLDALYISDELKMGACTVVGFPIREHKVHMSTIRGVLRSFHAWNQNTKASELTGELISYSIRARN
jgi:hypothetical protein